MSKRLWSVFTEDMDHCYFTGTAPVEIHHIFGGVNRKNSEKYGFIVPLRPDLHPNGVYAGQSAKLIDVKLKTMAQEYFEREYGTRDDFRRIFGKSYL
ncbi:MAG: phosphoenolpyruvate carboxykinase [Lachnospiraceae bacterium]